MFPGWMGLPMMMPVNQGQMLPQGSQGMGALPLRPGMLGNMPPGMPSSGMGTGDPAMGSAVNPAMSTGVNPAMTMPTIPSSPSDLPSLASSEIALSGKTEEEKQHAVVVRALREIAEKEKQKEILEKEEEKKPPPKKAGDAEDDKDKKPRCHLHQKPNKNCKKCQAALSQNSTKEPSGDKKTREALDADEIIRRNNSKMNEASDRKVLTCSPMLKEQIVKSSYFKSLLDITTVDGLVHEIIQYVDTLDVYNPGSKTSPSCFMCHVFRLSVMNQIENELGLLIDSREYAVVRCVGFLYMRFVTPPNELWDVLEEYLLDDMELTYSQEGGDVTTTIGEYVESLLIRDKYFDSPLPRLPVKVRQSMEEKVAPMLQHRKRMEANRRLFRTENVEDMSVEVCMDGTWLRGTAKELASNFPSRVKVKVRLEGGVDVKVHLGKVVLVDDEWSDHEDKGGRRRKRSRSRSRGRRGGGGQTDWSRWKGKSDAEMLEELRERARESAVCGHGKVYSKRPLNFDASMASTALPNPGQTPYETDSSSSRRRRRTEEEEAAEQAAAQRKRDEEGERQRRLASVYKKYCGTPSSGSAYAAKSHNDVDTPDTLRLG